MPRHPLPYLVAIMASFALATFISPDLFGAPPIVRGAVIVVMLVVLVISGIMLIREFMR